MSLAISYTMNTYNELLKVMTEKTIDPRNNLSTVVQKYSHGIKLPPASEKPLCNEWQWIQRPRADQGAENERQLSTKL